LLAAPLLAAPALLSAPAAADEGPPSALAALERRHGGRLGVAILDTASLKLVAQRGDERFAMCSTFKFLAAACVLARVDRGEESLGRRVVYGKADLVPYSPVTEKHAGEGGLTIGEICEAAELNEARLGDPRDTTTPATMVEVMRRTVLGTALSTGSREQLAAWLVANKTGDKRLRAGVPKGWQVGDKTGSGANNATNDIAVIWPPGGAPIVVAAYYAEARGSDEERSAVLAEVGRLAAAL
jgi:beta-lactamase class A